MHSVIRTGSLVAALALLSAVVPARIAAESYGQVTPSAGSTVTGSTQSTGTTGYGGATTAITTDSVSSPCPPSLAYDLTWNGDPVRKLGRGVANTLLGWLEIPLAIQRVAATEGPVAGVSVGLLYGLGAGLTRTAVGVGEALTFVFPMPEIGYGPILKPEFLLNPSAPDMFPTLPPLFPESGGR